MKIRNLHLALIAFTTFSFQLLTSNIQAQGCFSSSANFPGPFNPKSIITADFNNDGKKDLATANSFMNSVSILLGDGTGGFNDSSSFNVGIKPYSVINGDFNLDGNVDLATANINSNNVSVLLGNGTGSFAPAVNFSVGSYPISISSDDFNNDTYPDLAIANLGSNTISVIFGNGAGSFGAPNNFVVGNHPVSIICADFNGDNNADLATASDNYPNEVSILLGNGAGGFGSVTNLNLGYSFRSIISADFNGDNNADLAMVDSMANNISVILGNGTGNFGPASTFTVGNGPHSIISADFNGDGKSDLAVANQFSNNVSVLLGDGTGGFGSAAYFTVGDGPISLISADFNGDLKADLAVANDYSFNVSVLINTLTPVTASATATTVCAGTLITLTGGGNGSFVWTGGVINGVPFPAPTSTTTYTVAGTSAGCTNTAAITITINSLPVSNAGNDLIVCSGTAGSIGAADVSGNTYIWSPSSGLSDATISNPANTTINGTSTPLVTTYTVTTTITLTGCQSTDVSVITVNPQPVLVITNPAAVCSPIMADITTAAITLGSTGGGTLTYWTNLIATNSLSSPNTIGTSGTYYIMAATTGGCADTNSVTVVINPEDSATFTTQDESSKLYCDGSIKAHIFGGTGTILAQWLNSNQTVISSIDSIGALCPGTYTLHLIDDNLCTNTYTRAILAGPIPPSPPVCMITVDSTNTHNIVVWEKTSLDLAVTDSFLVYREINTNVYQRIATVSSDSLSIFDDLSANPATTGYRYKLKCKNKHGVASAFSNYHNTIYLTNNGANFNWTPYQIENNTTPVSNYNVFRDDNSTGNFQNIGNTTGNQFGYTDINFASYPNAQYYVEAVMVSGACLPTRSGFAASRSNVKHFGISGVQPLNNAPAISIYPNPTGNALNITGITGKTLLRMYNVVGELMIEKEVENNNTINTSQLSEGIYMLLTESKTGRSFNKVVVSH